MNLLSIIRYMKGYISVKISGGFPERFINLCAKNKINIWDVVYGADGTTIKLYADSFIKLRELKRKSGVNIEITEKNGLIFLLKEYKNRKLMIGGIILSLIIMLSLNMFVCNIEITGNESISDEDILLSAEKNGLKFGTFTPMFDEAKASRQAVNLFNGKILWMSVNIRGSKATIEIRENNRKSDKTESEHLPCNYISDKDGILYSSQTFSGEQKARNGSPVTKGSILISGVFENADGGTAYTHSDGIFIAETERELSGKFQIKNCIGSLTEKKQCYFLHFFGLEIPLNLTAFLQKEPNVSYSKMIDFKGNILPLGFKKTVYFFKSTENTNKLNTLIYTDTYTCGEYKEFENTKIINSCYELRQSSDICFIASSYDCLDFIGEKVPIKTES